MAADLSFRAVSPRITQAPYANRTIHSSALRRGIRLPAMLSGGVLFPPPPKYDTISNRTVSLFHPIVRSKAHQTLVTYLCFSAVHGRIRTGFCVQALKSRSKGVNRLLEVDDGFDDEFWDGDEDEDEDEDEVLVPLGKTREWLENRPRGFGEGKVYNTSIEDKLLEEMEQSRQAQLADINKLKDNPQKSKPMPKLKPEQGYEKKSSEDVPNGFRVRLTNLPKKKNIHRDLRSAFKEISGIVDIIPVVSGNEKTRDPICKGLAFVDFKTKDEAYRFVQTFSRRSVTFGGIQKQIKCAMENESFSNLAHAQSVDGKHNAYHLLAPSLKGGLGADSDMDDPSLDSWGKSSSGEYNDANFVHTTKQCDDDQDRGFSPLLASGGVDNMVPPMESTTNSLHLKHVAGNQETGRKPSSKQKKKKIPKLSISSGRLRVREKAVLSNVFSKYVANSHLSSGEQS